jgi:hypothetical protein
MSSNYTVIIESFAERHYIKSFSKKYKGAWDATWKGIAAEFQRMDSLFSTSIAETIIDAGTIKICKTEFRVQGTKESRKSSGNRCIVAVHTDIKTVNVLLAYCKDDLGNGPETATWKSMVRENYKNYSMLL